MAPSNNRRPSKAERTAEARERERFQREAQARKDRRASLLLRWGVVTAAVVIVAVIVVIVLNNIRGQVPDAGPAPRHGNEFGGVTLTSSGQLAETAGGEVSVEALPEAAGELPTGVAPAADGEPVPVVAYVDVNCVHCADFEARHAEQLRQWLDAGDITLEYRNVAYLDRSSQTDYSSRGANALACVADAAPEAYFDFATELFANYEDGELDDDGLAGLAAQAGAGEIFSCLAENTFRPWVAYTTKAAQADDIGGTPTVYVDGQEVPNAVEDFAAAVERAIG